MGKSSVLGPTGVACLYPCFARLTRDNGDAENSLNRDLTCFIRVTSPPTNFSHEALGLVMHDETLLDTRSIVVITKLRSGTWTNLMVHERIRKHLGLGSVHTISVQSSSFLERCVHL